MRLIDSDTIDDYLGEWAEEFYKKAENADADFMDGYCMTLNKIPSIMVPTVDAIPVEWIKEWRDEIVEHPLYTEKERFLITDAFNDMLETWAERKS